VAIIERGETHTSVRLLHRARLGDREAVEALFARHAPRLLGWARGRLPQWARDLADTADIVQETLLRVFRRIDRFESRKADALQGYLREAVVNRIKDECRRAERLPARSGPPPEARRDVLNPTPVDEVMGQEAANRYRRALQGLRREEQEAIVARVELGFTHAQIALVLGRRTPDAARMAVGRALLRLAQAMDQTLV
jgi:RNA polymerase sigma-70 factor (ECF subfamily)